MPELPEPSSSAGPDFPSLQRIGEFLRTILRLERSFRELKAENAALRSKLDELQRIVDDHNGQLKQIGDFTRTAMENRVEARAEEVATRATERMLNLLFDKEK
jgi:predicted RNase H-like nuclease (RuvC/YqgF family)